MSSLIKHELEDTFALHLRDAEDELMYAEGPDGENDLSKPQRAVIYGPGTKQFAQAVARANNRNIERLQRKGKMKLTADEILKDRAEFARDVTRELENIDSDKGAVGADLFMEVYGNPKLSYLAEQVEANARNTVNFKKRSSKS